MEFKDDGGEPLWVVLDDIPLLLAELDPSEQRSSRRLPGVTQSFGSSIGSTKVRILQISKSSTTVTSFTLRDDE
jgi:hypothetical protein